MCDPVTMAVVAGVAASANILQQQQQADISNDLEKLLYGQRKEAAFETFAALQSRELEERTKAAQGIRQAATQARQAAGAAKLQALEGGVGGQSVNTLLDQFERGELANVGIIRGNLESAAKQLRDQARAAGRIQGPHKTFGPLDTPLGILASTLQVGTAAASAGGSAAGSAPIA